MNWVSVEEGLPKHGQVVMTLSGDHSYDAVFDANSGQFISGICVCLRVTHWQPLLPPAAQ